MKKIFVRYQPVYEFRKEFEDRILKYKRYSLFKTNIKYIKDIKYKNYDFAIAKIKNYINSYEKMTVGKKRKGNNREGHFFKIQVSKEFFQKDLKIKRNKIIEKIIKNLTINDKDKCTNLTYICFKEKTPGESLFINILLFDREIYPEGKVIEKHRVAKNNVYLNKNLEVTDKHSQDSKLVARRGEKYKYREKIYVSETKPRLFIVNSRRKDNNELFAILINSVRNQIEHLIRSSNKEKSNIFFKFKKEIQKFKVKRYSKNKIYINIIKRRTYLINNFINELSYSVLKFTHNEIEKIKNMIDELRNSTNILFVEQTIKDLHKLILN